MKKIAKKILIDVLWRLMGRRNLTRFARFLTNQVRLDVNNDMVSNGERIVQKAFCDIAQSIKMPVIVFDAGANVGDWTLGLLAIAHSKHISNIKIYAFEPCEGTYLTLSKNIEKYGNASTVCPTRLALSDHPGTATLYVVDDNVGTNSLHEHSDLEISQKKEISLTTVDIYCRENKIEHLNLLKIDAEGHDQLIIEGAKEMLKRAAIDFLQFEYNHRWISSRHFLQDAFELLEPYGYRIGKITPKGIEFYHNWHYELESFQEANYLACKEENMSKFPIISWWNTPQSIT